MKRTGEATARSRESEPQWRREVARCRAEIAAIEALLLGGHPDIEGLCMALSDWSAEVRILEGAEAGKPPDLEPGGVRKAGRYHSIVDSTESMR